MKVHLMPNRKAVYIVDDNSIIRASLTIFLRAASFNPHPFASGSDFIENLPHLQPGCVVLDICMPGLDGFGVLEQLGTDMLQKFPVIVVTGHGDIGAAVNAMKLGASDFIEKPYENHRLIESINDILSGLDQQIIALEERERARKLVERLSRREADVLHGLVSGLTNKDVSDALGLSVRTVEMHRSHMMDRLGVTKLVEAMRIAFSAGLLH